MSGCIHIYCGDGKGKTTAAVGLAVRAAGRGRRTLMARFLKTDDSGEVTALARIPEITLIPCQKSFGFTFQMNEQQKQEAAIYYQDVFHQVCKKATETPGCDLLILDEILAACSSGLVCEEELTEFLQQKPESLEVILTGRNPSKRLLDLADYVSEIHKEKHPYDSGLGAREGIEY